MSMPKPPDRSQDDTPTPESRTKKPYEKPTFVHETVFETMALACGKISSTSGQCRFNTKNS